ncbi:MAG: FAD-binding protein [Treponema sp.]|jgi:succinate dehydrogenase/fumarate reductase flavoprotein subunit|nr:FAD-binding protein [Treponema sp.]
MEEKTLVIRDIPVKVYCFSAVIAGSGAAGFNAADTLLRENMKDIAMISESVLAGTSRNTGSDKQTYYKLSLSGGEKDSVRALAETLFAGQSMDGDIALCEAASSVPCFNKLALLGLPFPKNRYGEYVGYKTDHDPARRATSAGPYTSKLMTEALEKSARESGLVIFDRMQIIKLIAHNEKVLGVLCLNLNSPEDPLNRYVLFRSPSIVWATGGPATMFSASVYPGSQNGATGIAFEAGAAGRNLTEWQYGLASIHPRWNVSGTYMQVLPRFVSTGRDGNDEREFLPDFFADTAQMLSLVFLKGYQWPFDARKLFGAGTQNAASGGSKAAGSSLIDIIVFLETQKGRRVFLDFTHNPLLAAEIDYASLSAECRDYLAAAGACFGTPIERLDTMNKPAVDFYRDKGVDLHSQMLEIAVCVQHNNGGLAVDCWWHSNIEGLFPVGEAAGTHGVFRPGGSALNSGQAGSMRAALYIARKRKNIPNNMEQLEIPLGEIFAEISSIMAVNESERNVPALITAARERMSMAGGMFRDETLINRALEETKKQLDNFVEMVRISGAKDLSMVFRLKDLLICQYVYLSAMADYIRHGGKSRGSALYYHKDGARPHPALPGECAALLDRGELASMIQEITCKNGTCSPVWRPVRPIPPADDFFENVWRTYRENGNVEVF